MSWESSRLLYLARHAEPDAHEAGLTSTGSLQAQHLGQRLAPLSVRRIIHGPLPRAAATAQIVARQFELSPLLVEDERAGDYVPYLPRLEEIPDAWADTVMSFMREVSEDEAFRGAALVSRQVDRPRNLAVGGF